MSRVIIITSCARRNASANGKDLVSLILQLAYMYQRFTSDSLMDMFIITCVTLSQPSDAVNSMVMDTSDIDRNISTLVENNHVTAMLVKDPKTWGRPYWTLDVTAQYLLTDQCLRITTSIEFLYKQLEALYIHTVVGQ